MTTELDRIFSALADANRRHIIDLLQSGNFSLMDLSTHFDISFQAVSKHLKVLENAKLITKKKKGKYVLCSFRKDQLEIVANWIREHHEFWNKRLGDPEKFLSASSKSSYGWRIKE